MIFKAVSEIKDRSLQRRIQSYCTSLMNCWPWVIVCMLGRIENAMIAAIRSVDQYSSDSIEAK